jgi:hypothetical protein
MLTSIFYGTFIDEKKLTPVRLAYLALMWLGLPILFLHLFMNAFVGFLFQMALMGYQDVAEASYREPYYTWTGDIGIHELRITPLEGENGFSPLTAKDVRIDMPSWGVLMQVAGALNSDEVGSEEYESRSLTFIDKIDHVGIHFQGLKTEFDDGLPEVLGYFGLSSAAPFEAEGCVSDGYWDGDEVEKMGIADEGVDLNFTLGTLAETGTVTLKGTLKAPAASEVNFEQHYKATRLSSFIEADEKDRIYVYQNIEVRDAGFNKARNAFCAKRDGVSPEEFVERHIQSIHCLLRM